MDRIQQILSTALKIAIAMALFVFLLNILGGLLIIFAVIAALGAVFALFRRKRSSDSVSGSYSYFEFRDGKWRESSENIFRRFLPK